MLLFNYEHPCIVLGILIASFLILFIFLPYVVCQRFLHPLAKYPGPFAASLTNVWKAYYVYHGILHEQLVEQHRKYGPVVRIGPNDLHFWSQDAVIPIYKAGKSMGKTEFYDAFTTFNPNLFGTRVESIHSLRRRQLAHGFSQVSIEKMEPVIEGQMKIFMDDLKGLSKTGQIFDLKNLISCLVLDILGEVAFSRSFNAQMAGGAPELSAISDHLLLACVIGELPYQGFMKALIAWSPVPWIRRLIKSRAHLKSTCADCVSHGLRNRTGRQDLLQSLINAKDPETGEKLTELEINTEAFAMLVAGSHSTAGTLTFLLWHILQHPNILAKVVREIDETLGPLPHNKIAYPINGLEASLKYTMACIRENFRMNPVFSMNLWRRVHSDEVQIGDYHIPHGTNVCISNYVLHHNPTIWGNDHDIYNPDRWLDMELNPENNLRYLIPFSTGHRMCIGKNLAMTNILKITTTLLAMFEFEPLSKRSTVRLRSSGIGEMEGQFLCQVKLRDRST